MPHKAESTSHLGSLENMVFDNRHLRELPLDPEKNNFVRQVSGAVYSRVAPTPVRDPVLVSCSPDALVRI